MQPDSGTEWLESVAEWLNRYNDTGIVPVVIMFACTAVAALMFWVRVEPTAEEHEKDVFFVVVGTPLLINCIFLLTKTLFPPTDTTLPPVVWITRCVEIVDQVVNWPATTLVGQDAAIIFQIVTFIFGMYWFNKTKFFKIDPPATRDSKISKTKIIFLVPLAFFMMPLAIWVSWIIFVFAKCMGIYECCCQIKETRDWLHSTERTSGKKKEVLRITHSTDPENLWNKIAQKPGMQGKTYDVITDGCRNKTARQNALLNHLEMYFVVKDDRTVK
jgi:hypothetical protein